MNPGDQTARAGAGADFGADTPHGGLQLRVAGDEPVACAAQAALCLARAEALLALLDAWLAAAADPLPLEWRWHESQGPRDAGPAAHAEWTWGTHPEVAVQGSISLPWPLLRRLPPPGPALAPMLHWQAQAACCVLATPDLPEEELALLEPGGLLLLHQAFVPGWPARLRAQVEMPGQGLAVSLARPDAPLAWAGEGGPDDGRQPGWEVRCDLDIALSPAQLCGWPGAAALPPLAADAALWPLHPATPAGRWCQARGPLVPWGRGHAMLIAATHLSGGD